MDPDPTTTLPQENIKVKVVTVALFASVITALIIGAFLFFATDHFRSKDSLNLIPTDTTPLANQIITEESAITEAVEKVNPAVVSIIITKDLPVYERRFETFDPFTDDFFQQFFNQPEQRGTQRQEVGGGSGFIVTADGMVVTNKHVVSDENAEYTVVTNTDEKFSAEVAAIHPTSDLAVLRITSDKDDFPIVELGDSTNLKLGQLVVAIGNALAEFRNTVSLGVISGLSRSITAGGGLDEPETLEGLIQTDAAINPGNSGGPLINLAGQVIGVNTAIVSGAEGIGFAIPVEVVKQSVDSVKETGKISRPYLGVRYVLIDEQVKEENNLSIDYGALVLRGETRMDLAIMPGSPADKAGIRENDIILEVNGMRVDAKNSLAKLIGRQKVGDEITLKIMRAGKEQSVKVRLEELATQ